MEEASFAIDAAPSAAGRCPPTAWRVADVVTLTQLSVAAARSYEILG